MASKENPDLSIVILNYNVRDLVLKCLESVFKHKKPSDKWQIIVVDNASSDGSVEAIRKRYGMDSRFRGNDKEGGNDEVVELIASKVNKGFAGGNNLAINKIKAPVVLFLNPDTIVVNGAIQKSLVYLLGNPDIGAVGCKVEFPDGKLDYSCHRGFPTPWNAFCYFTGLANAFPKSPIFAGYTATYLDISKIHEVDCINGAFLMVRKIAAEQIGFWDEDYFFNGEDIEFCYNLKEKGWKIFFYPEVKIIHYKGSSSGLQSTAQVSVDKERKIRVAKFTTEAMRIFYMKHCYKNYPPILRDLVLLGIKSLEHYRKFKIVTGLRYE